MRYMSDEPRGPAYPLWERVNRERALRRWTWVRLKDETGVARSTVDKWKTQPRSPQAATVLAVTGPLEMDDVLALTLAGILPGLNEDETRAVKGFRSAAEKWADEERDEGDADGEDA